MKRKTKNLLIAATVLVTFVCMVNAAWLVVQTGGIAGWYGSNMPQAVWNEDAIVLQKFLLWCRLLAGIAFDVLIVLFMFRSLAAVKSGTLFPRANALVLLAASVSYFLYSICNSNMGILMESDRLFSIADSDLMFPLVLFAFALIYSMAVKVSEENNLTI